MSIALLRILTLQAKFTQMTLSLDTRIEGEQRHRQLWTALVIITVLLLCFGGMFFSNTGNPGTYGANPFAEITPNSLMLSGYLITQKSKTQFTATTANPTTNDLEFSWRASITQ